MSEITGRAKKYDGTAIDYVSIFNWDDGQCLAQVVPDLTGAWSYSYVGEINIGITYVADGCEPITHGAYTFVGEWSPSLLFTNSELGFWYDPSDLTTMFKDVQMSQQVTKNGDRVAVILDKSGNNRHLVQSDANAMPIYRTDGARRWIESDGVNDILVSNGSFDLSVDSISLIAATRMITTKPAGILHIVGTTPQGINMGSDALHTRPISGSSAYGVAYPRPQNTDPIIGSMILNKSTRDYTGYFNSVAQGVTKLGSTAWYNTPSQVVLGANRPPNLNPAYGNSVFYGAIMTQNLMSDVDRVLVEQYLAEKSGVLLT